MPGSFVRVVLPLMLLASAMPLALHAQITQGTPNPATVTIAVDAAAQGREVPDTLFGSFLEPIGNSINNGIDAQILVNRSLEGGLWNHVNLENLYREQPELIASSNETGIPLPWLPLNAEAGNRYELHVGNAANSWQSLELLGNPDALTGIMQKVYLPVQRTLGYKVSFYGKHVSGPTQMTVSLRSREDNAVLAQASVTAASGEWTKYTATLQLKPGQVRRLEAVNFAVAVEGDERADIDQLSLMPDDAIDGLDPDAVAMAKAMHLTELRFGGNFSSYYHWREGIGPLDKRVAMKNIAWGIPEYNDFGTDEFLELCRLIHTEPQFDLNMGSGTPQEAAAWVRYIRERYKGSVLFELGNELYGKWQVGFPTLGELAARTLAFSKAVRAVDPDAVLIATGKGPVGFETWNGTQLSNPPGTFQDLSVHFIEGTNHAEKRDASPDFLAAAAYATPYAVGDDFNKMQQQVDAAPGWNGKAHFAVTEWLFNSKGFGERNFTNESPSWVNEGGAVMAAGFFNTLLRHSDQVKIADMTGLMEFAGIWKKRGQVYASPAYYAFQMYAGSKGGTIVPVTTDSGTYGVQGGIAPLPTLTGVPYVDATAVRSRDGAELTLYCINRSLRQDLPVRIALQGFVPEGTVTVQQIRSADRYEENTEIEPSHVVPRSASFAAPKSGPVTVTLPSESVTMLRFHRAGF